MDNITYISHRINTVQELKKIPEEYGIEIDLRDYQENIILQHDPFKSGELFTDFIKEFNHKIIILNIKSEGIEYKILEILKNNNITNYFFLDSSFPMIYKLLKITDKIAIRFSEFESLESVLTMKNKIQWVWVDCFTKFPLSLKTYTILKKYFKLCYVSPELQQQYDKIMEYKHFFLNFNLIPNAICCKYYNINLYKKKRIISFSLWGDIKLYCIGAIKNAILAKKYFPEWYCRFYYDETVPIIIIDFLKSMDNTELYFIQKPSGGTKYKENGQYGMLWRYYPINDTNVDIFIARDVDSRISLYEYNIINQFIKGDNIIHCFRNTNEPLCRGGTFSFKNFNNLINNTTKLDFKKIISDIDSSNTPIYTDETFLNNKILPLYSNRYCSNVRKFNIPTPTYCGQYVGQVLDEYDKPFDKIDHIQEFNFNNNYDDLDLIINNLFLV